MPTQITQSESEGRVFFRVEGDLLVEDALLLEKIVIETQTESDRDITVDFADLAFLDSESATILKRLAGYPSIELQGMEIFLQSAIDQAERAAS